MHNQLQKAIELARKTGDRLIVYNSQKKDIFVVMSLDEYEKLVIGRSEVRNLTEDELLDKINRDVAIWKSEQNIELLKSSERDYYTQDKIDHSPDFSKIDEILDKADQKISKFSENENSLSSPEPEKKQKNHWVIPSERKEAAEEIIEEDRQYLIEEKF